MEKEKYAVFCLSLRQKFLDKLKYEAFRKDVRIAKVFDELLGERYKNE